jgi:hypothetical protein
MVALLDSKDWVDKGNDLSTMVSFGTNLVAIDPAELALLQLVLFARSRDRRLGK